MTSRTKDRKRNLGPSRFTSSPLKPLFRLVDIPHGARLDSQSRGPTAAFICFAVQRAIQFSTRNNLRLCTYICTCKYTHTHTHVRMYAVGKRIFLARTKIPLFLVVLRCARRKTYVKLPFHRRNQFIFKFPRCEEYTS